MKHRLTRFGARGLLGLALLFVPAPVGAQAPDKQPAANAEDLIFFGAGRPLVIRLHVSHDGKTPRELRDAYVERWMKFYDRNGDGVLTGDEASAVPGLQSLQQLRNNNFFVQQGNPKDFGQLDANGDGKVTRAELTLYFERAGFTPIRLLFGAARGTSDPVSDALFKALDMDKAGKLSRAGIKKAADELLSRLDKDDDELLRPEELAPGLVAGALPPGGVGLPRPKQPAGGRAGGAFFLASPGESDGQLALVLLSTLDKDRDLALSREESGLDAEAFKRLDRSGDGKLDLDELARWHLGAADLEMRVRLGKLDRGEAAVELLKPGKVKALPAGDSGLRLSFSGTQLTVQRAVATNQGVQFVRNNFQLQQLRAILEATRRDHVEMKDLDGQQAQFLRPLLKVADQNGDGKLTMKEAEEFFALAADSGNSSFSLSAAELGRGLFQMLDADRDGRLSLRELRTAWDRLAPLDTNGDGLIEVDEIAKVFEVSVVRGAVGFGGVGTAVRPQRAERGPAWFHRMDRNGDGDVGRREFLGSAEEFARIDADGDGLISVDEALAHDRKSRPKQK